MMIVYEVSALVADDLAKCFCKFMTDDHIGKVLATGCFIGATLLRSDSGRYCVRYVAETKLKLDRYLNEHSSRLRSEFLTRFPHGVTLSREVWDVLVVVGDKNAAATS